jgi:hypothetical protein
MVNNVLQYQQCPVVGIDIHGDEHFIYANKTLSNP